ncbi:MAG: glycosyl hydrolase family 28-related protein [Terriglobales bacterium]
MRKKPSPAFLLFFAFMIFFYSNYGHAQAWSGILSPTYGSGACTLAPSSAPAACGIDWSTAGVGGIPPRTTLCSTISASTYGNGSSDATSGIQSALNSCANGQTVSLSAGTFLIKSPLNIPSNVTLRGAGPDQTILTTKGSNSNAGALNLGSTIPSASTVNITSGAKGGSTSLVVSSASGMSVGGYLEVVEANQSWVSSKGGEGNCTWCDSWNGAKSRGQIVQITSLSGTTVGISPALYSDYANTPQAVYFTMGTQYAGIEEFQIYQNNTGYFDAIHFSGCAYCWAKGVEVNYADGDFVEVHWSSHVEIRDSYFSNAFAHSPGQTDAAIELLNKTSDTLVENNIVERCHVCVFLSRGAAGNVVSYNYMEGEYDASATNFLESGIGAHGAHPQFNLIEGNVVPKMDFDEIWGSSSHWTLFRNWATGATQACTPLNGRGTVDCSKGWWPFQDDAAILMDHLSVYSNIVGNVIGSAAQNGLLAYGSPTSHTAMVAFPTNRSYDSTNYNLSFGYGEASDDGSGNGCDGSSNPPCHSQAASQTAFMHGDYTNADGNVLWASGVTHSLPSSFYLSSQPSWWGSLPFPAIGPDVTGSTGAGGHATLGASNPAQNCYINVMGGSEGGAGSPLTFSADKCYASGGGQSVPPPTQLKATVH